ncbi:Ger(x)C family spore germination protein [Paenibacillus silviterrae]|uniref:Ger(x)C family spore germination protein n=1 Tax=Paenibacillus silviterrae TaxID=3242194 RepID=UPI002542CBCC|nr:Ger(x)C family spore germination protein [Paenibacillus chinjuensis]
MRKTVILMVLGSLSLLLTGCWDQLELEEQAYVVVMGLDKGAPGMVDVTFQIANPQVGSTDKGSAQNEPPSDTVTFSTPDILSAKDIANSIVTRTISFSHLRTIIVGEELAKSSLFHHVMAAATRDPELRSESNLVVTNHRARDFIHNNKPKLETRPHKYYEFMQDRWRDTGLVPYSTLTRYFQRLGGDALYLAIYASAKPHPTTKKRNEDQYKAGEIPHDSGDPAEMLGSAVFNSGRMIGTLTGEETRFALYLRRKALVHSFIASYKDPLNPKFQISVRMIKEEDTKIKVNTEGDRAQVKVTVPIVLQVLSIPSLTNYVTDTENQKKLIASLEKQFEQISRKVVEKSQKQFKADPFLWHLNARGTFKTLPEYLAYDWSKQFTDATVDIHFDCRIESFGKQLLPPLAGRALVEQEEKQ